MIVDTSLLFMRFWHITVAWVQWVDGQVEMEPHESPITSGSSWLPRGRGEVYIPNNTVCVVGMMYVYSRKHLWELVSPLKSDAVEYKA